MSFAQRVEVSLILSYTGAVSSGITTVLPLKLIFEILLKTLLNV